MSAAPQLDPLEPSPLASARLQRKLTVDEAARRAGISPEQIRWLEEGRVYRFPVADDALIAVVLYATALGIEQDEARALARLPVEPKPPRFSRTRIVAVAPAPAGGERRTASRRLEQRRPQLGELRLQVRRHFFCDGLPDEAPQIRLEAVALPAVRAEVQVLFRNRPLLLVEIAVEERLQELLASLARIHRKAAHAP